MKSGGRKRRRRLRASARVGKSVKVGQFFFFLHLSSTNPLKYPFINVQCSQATLFGYCGSTSAIGMVVGDGGMGGQRKIGENGKGQGFVSLKVNHVFICGRSGEESQLYVPPSPFTSLKEHVHDLAH